MPLEGLAGIPLGLPDLILVGAVHPEEEFFLSALRLPTAAINRLDGLKGLEVVGDVCGQVAEQGWSNAEDQVDFVGRAVLAQLAHDGLDGREVGLWFAAQVHVPLVLAHVSVENCGLRCRHKILLIT